MRDSATSVFEKVRIRYLFLVLFLAMALASGLTVDVGQRWPPFWRQVAAYWLLYGVLAGTIAVFVLLWNLPIRLNLVRWPARVQLITGLQLTAFTIAVSVAAYFAMLYVMYFVSPKFAQSWYVAARSVIYADEVAYGQLANVLYLLSLCVLAPLLEEITFRGIVLDRWIHKWGIRTGILSSSALFALFHLNPLGAFVFAITMSFLYLKTRSLVLPMICHAANNFVGWLWAFGSLAIHGPAPSVGQWLSTRMPEAIVSAAIAVWWIVRYEKRIRNELLTSRTAA